MGSVQTARMSVLKFPRPGLGMGAHGRLSRTRALSAARLLVAANRIQLCALPGQFAATTLACRCPPVLSPTRLHSTYLELFEAVRVPPSSAAISSDRITSCRVSCADRLARPSPYYAQISVADSSIAALSDHESSDSEDVPAKAVGKQPVAEAAPAVDDDEDEDDSDVGEDEYAHAILPPHSLVLIMRQICG